MATGTIPMKLCLFYCGKDAFCQLICLQKYGTLSPFTDASIKCLKVLSSDNLLSVSTQAELVSCLDGVSQIRISSGFQTDFLGGLSSLASCSVNSCRRDHNQFTKSVALVNQCTEKCAERGDDTGIVCYLRCVVANVVG
jgi:hypothetical protein